MNTKFITASVFTFISSSIVQVADVAAVVAVPKKPKHVTSSVIVSPSFSWSGFYFGGQLGSLASKFSAAIPDVSIPLFSDEGNNNKKWIPIQKEYLPELSGFAGGFYLGANIDFGNNFILGIDTDIVLSGREDTKTIPNYEDFGKNQGKIFLKDGGEVLRSVIKILRSAIKSYRESDEAEKDGITFSHSVKEKWVGATRIRIGFAANRIMPHISGGVGYGQFQDVLSTSIIGKKTFNATSDDTKMMIGYTLGGGVDFAMSGNVILRAEYRYSDFGKKKFKDEIELNYTTNDFRVGVAYKF